jgi:hypothetical protein
MDLLALITTTVARTVCLSKSSSLNFDGIYFTRSHSHSDRHWPTAYLAVDDKFRTAFARVERNLEIFPAMRTGDCQEFAHKPTVTQVANFANP